MNTLTVLQKIDVRTNQVQSIRHAALHARLNWDGNRFTDHKRPRQIRQGENK